MSMSAVERMRAASIHKRLCPCICMYVLHTCTYIGCPKTGYGKQPPRLAKAQNAPIRRDSSGTQREAPSVVYQTYPTAARLSAARVLI